MLTQLLIYLIIIIFSFELMVIIRKPFEEIIPLTIMFIVFLIFYFGILVNLIIGLVSVFFLMTVLFVPTVKIFRQEKVLIKQQFSVSFVMYTILFWGLSYLNVGRVSYTWDEFSHWADVVKVMVIWDDFGTVPDADLLCASYPPGMAIFQYFVQKINYLCRDIKYSEWRLFFSYQLFTYSLFMPFTKGLKKSISSIVSTTLIIFLTPSFFLNLFFQSILIDTFLATLMGVGMAFVCVSDMEEPYYSIMSLSIISMLALSKAVGVYFGLVVGFLYLVRLSYKHVIQSKNCRTCVKYIALCVISIALPSILWRLHVKLSNCYVVFSNKADLRTVIDVVLQKGDAVSQDIWNCFITQLGTPSINLNNLGIMCTIPFAFILILFFLELSLREYNKKDRNNDFISINIIRIVISISFTIYLFGLGITYLFEIPERTLPSFARYVSIYLLAIFSMGVSILMADFNKKNVRSHLVVLLVVCIVLFSPHRLVMVFLSGQYTVNSLQDRSAYINITEQVEKYANGRKLNIFLVDQNGDGTVFWHLHNILRPCNVRNNANFRKWSWSLGQNSNAWYTFDIPKEELKSELIKNYDAVLIWKIDDYFINEYSDLFLEADTIREQSIYEVNKNTGLLEYSSN